MKGVVLDENERVIASLVPDDPEQLYKHKNQIAAITNKRLLFNPLTVFISKNVNLILRDSIFLFGKSIADRHPIL